MNKAKQVLMVEARKLKLKAQQKENEAKRLREQALDLEAQASKLND